MLKKVKWGGFGVKKRSSTALLGQCFKSQEALDLGPWPWPGSAPVTCVKSISERQYPAHSSSWRPQLVASLVLFARIGGGNTAACSFCWSLCLGLVDRCRIYTSLSFWRLHCLSPAPPSRGTDPPSTPQQPPLPNASEFLIVYSKKEWLMLGIPELVYHLYDSYLGKLWLYLGLSFAERNTLLFFPNKIRGQLAIVWDS